MTFSPALVTRHVVTTATWGFAGLLLLLFLATPYLPMVDFPQHAAQIAVWAHLSDPQLGFSRYFELNAGTPYLGAYAPARLLAELVGVVPALKVVVWASVVGHLAAFSLFVRRLGYPKWLGLLGLPVALGYPFFFGLVSFLAALPFVLLSSTAALHHRETASLRSGLILSTALVAALCAHGFALGIALLFVAPLLLRGRQGLLRRLAPLAAPAVVWAAWVQPSGSIRTIGPTHWGPRLTEILWSPSLWFAASGADRTAIGFGCAAVILAAFAIGRPSREPERWLPLALLVAAYCLWPLMLRGFGPIHPRFAAFFLPALLLAFEPESREPSPWPPLLVVAFTGAWFTLLTVRSAAFTRETQPVRNFIAAMPRDLWVRPVIFERDSSAFPWLPALLHVSAYYMVEKGGLQGYSFAMYPTSVIRYRSTIVPGMSSGAEWAPEWFSGEAELDAYDCFLVRSSTDRTAALFGKRASEVTLAFHEGSFWAYRAKHPPLAGTTTPAEGS